MAMELQHLDDTQLIQRGRELQDLYRSYVPGAVANQLASGRSMDARESQVTVLFVDIRGFSTYSERREASEIFSTVNRYTTLVSRIVGDNAGTVVEFNGDGMMAVFGAPEPTPSKERAAVVAAEEIIAAIAAHPIEGTQDTRAPLQVGIGIATGMALVGSIRAADRRIWSALGSTTNLASRLQALSRQLGAAIVIDRATHQNAGPFGARFARHPQSRIRGLAEPLDVFARPLEI